MSARILRIKEIIAECIRSCPIAPEEMVAETTLRENLESDSLERVEIAMALEEEFNVEIDDEVAEGFQTVGEIIDHINKALTD